MQTEKSIKRTAAEARNAKWAAKTPEEQLTDLNRRFPNGAKEQKKRIQAKIQAGGNT